VAVREDQAGLTADERDKFVDGILSLKQQPSMLHAGSPTLSRYDDYVVLHVRAMMTMSASWAHQGPAFFPWHRVILVHLEREIQQAIDDPDFGLPYWDWTRTGAAADTPLRADFLGGDGRDGDHQVMDGPFAFAADNWRLNVVDGPGAPNFLQRRLGKDFDFATGQIVDITLPDAAAQDQALDLLWYDSSPWDVTSSRDQSFRNRAEVRLHNLVHRWVGGSWLVDDQLFSGTMMQMASPNDPVFWMHHCNIDRLWSAWQDRHPFSAPYLPRAGAAPGHNLDDVLVFGEHRPWPDSYTPEMVENTYELGYSYEALPEPVAAAAHVAAIPRRIMVAPMHGGGHLLFPLEGELASTETLREPVASPGPMDAVARRTKEAPMRDRDRRHFPSEEELEGN
jgi:tyrosinase